MGRRLQLAAVCALVVVYGALSHLSNTGGSRRLGAALAVAPPLGACLGFLWRFVHPGIALAAALAAAALLYDGWAQIERNFSFIYLLQECGMYGLLALGFGRSLRPGATPLCTRLAARLGGPLTPPELRYTRRITLAWTLFLAALSLTILALYLLAPRTVWSIFVNFLALPLVALMFVAEYAVRRFVLPDAGRHGVLASVRVFLSSR